MSSAAPVLRRATAADLLAIPERDRFHEVIDGELVRKAMPSMRHGTVQVELAGELAGAYGLRPRGRGPGGWIFASETEIELEPSHFFRPDVAGWRRESLPKLPDEVPITQRPEWICEILSPSNPQNDLVKKMRVYHRCRVGHYWILDPIAETLSVYRWLLEGYLLIQSAEGRESIRAEPFAAVELTVHGLLEADPDE
jgi:Uma2 family endonuclease